MGTVGLSFGSPTSGTGFDVSTTVASIVANLQNVETPWKTQVSTLESQDTALSSLGTLFSNLSNDMSALTDFQGILSEKTGSSSNTNILELTAANSSAVAGTHTVVVTSLAQTSSGYLTPITNASDTLAGSLTIQVGSGTAQTITVGSSSNTLASLASAINTAGIGVTASVLTDASGSRLSLVSGTSGTGGNLTIASSITDATTSNAALSYTSGPVGANAQLTVDGVNLTSASNTVANLIPGVTFQLLSSAVGTQVQVVIANDNTDVESTLNSFVTDYNSLISAINTEQTNNGSGTAEPLYGSPTLSLLQQQLLGGLIAQNPNGYLDGIANTSDALSGSITIQSAGGFGLNYQGVAGSATVASNGKLAPVPNASDTLSGSISIQLGNGTAENVVIGAAPVSGAAANTVYTGTGSGYNQLSGLVTAINGANLGVTAAVASNALTLTANSIGAASSLTVDSNIHDISAQTVSVPTASGSNNLNGLASAINSANIGVTANLVNIGGETQLVLVSGTAGSSGALTVTSAVTDTATSKALNYNNVGSDITGLTSLGISVNNDGSLTLDSTSLDSVLNSDYSGVVGFFQDANSWGATFSNILTNAGTSTPSGILALAQTSNSNVESTLNADITKESSIISAEQASLTAELTSADEILQALPAQLNQANELYSALTGFNQNPGG